MKRLLASIKGRIFLWLFAVTSFLLIALGLLLYREARKIVFGAMDNTLHSKAQVITGLLHEEHGAMELELSEVISGEYTIPRSGHYYKVLMDGKILASSPSLVESGFDLASGKPEAVNEQLKEKIFTSMGPDGEPLRVLMQDVQAFGKSFEVFVAESLGGSIRMVEAFGRFLILATVISILIVCLTGLWIAKRSLAPLADFSGRIRTITHQTLGRRLGASTETQELTVLADSFNAMLDRLQKAFATERRLIADASHELKTPVSVIRAQCDVTLQRKREESEYIETIRTIRSVTDTMNAVVRDLLSLARLDSAILSPPDITDIPLKDCIGHALLLLEPLAAERRIRITTGIEDAITVRGDRDRLTEAFLNILENAIKYSGEHGLVEVSAVRGDGKATVLVRDSGKGIKKDDLERICDRFFRGDAARNTEGTGLGLSIAKAIVEVHGGGIRIESEEGRGTTCTVVLPEKQP